MLQFTDLLEPISQASPAGADLSFSPEVDAINAARQFDDPSLDQGEWVVALKDADWPFVYDKCIALLAAKTKDLRIAGWLVEAAAKTRQFEGMAAGFELISGLCDRYWEALYPSMDDGDLDQRIGNLAWLLVRAVALVKETPITEGRETAFSWTDFETARARANAALRTGEAVPVQAGQVELPAMEAARRKSSKGFYENLIASMARTEKAVSQLERALDARVGVEGPSFTPLKDVLATVLAAVERFGADQGLRLAAAPQGTEATNAAQNVGVVAAVQTGVISSREQALAQLRLVAEFFRRTEPHSPVAYLADRAANWGDMPLHTWLKSMVKDPASLAFIEEMLDVRADN